MTADPIQASRGARFAAEAKAPRDEAHTGAAPSAPDCLLSAAAFGCAAASGAVREAGAEAGPAAGTPSVRSWPATIAAITGGSVAFSSGTRVA